MVEQKGLKLLVFRKGARYFVAAGNLEGTLCDSGQTHKKISRVCYAFRTPTMFAPRLKEAGFDSIVCALAVISAVGQTQKHATIAFTGDIMMGTTYPSVELPSHEGRQ